MSDRLAEMRRMARERKTDGVVLAGPHPGVVDGHFFASVSELLIHDANSNGAVTRWGGAIWMESSPRIFAARCDLVEKFLEETGNWDFPPEWLLFIDADMTFPPDAVDRMLETVKANPDKDIKILGGLCFAGGRGSQAFPTLYTVKDPDNWTPEKELRLIRHYDYPKDSLVKVNATGGAFLMIHRQVFEDMKLKFGTIKGKPNPYIWFREYEQNGMPYGEDVFFGLMAGSIGHSTWVDTGMKIGHMKKYQLDEAIYEANKESYIAAARGSGLEVR